MGPTERAPQPSGNLPQRPRWHEVLRALREARGVTQDGWAAQLSVGRRTVQHWEAGERTPDPGAEAAILAYCHERGLFRPFSRGPLAGFALTPDLLHDLLAEARLDGNQPSPAGNGGEAGARAGLRTAPTALAEPRARLSNLPAALTSFVGREQELTAVRRTLAGTRLLTLTGAGGCGKTRLALELAGELLWAYPHGVYFVELAALADPALVPPTVAAALGLWTTGERPVTELLVEHLAARHLLLVLDNCEHLLGACAELVETLLRAGPHLEVVITSREPLGMGGETLWRVPPLSLPSTTAGALEADAVRLFRDRAQQYRPDFSLSTANTPAVVQICGRLDGIPLAIELAAAYVKVLSVEQIAARLSDRFRLLTGGSRTALPRQQTLRATMDWSYDLLSAPEQALLRRLSVFAGGFTLEATEVLGTSEGVSPIPDSRFPIPAEDILDVLRQLVDKSLVIAEPQDGAVRYRLLETVRQYAAEKLDAAGEAAAARDRHLAWCLALAETARGELRGPGEPAWLGRLEEEHDNLRAALAWSLTGPPGRSPDRRGVGDRTDPRSSGGIGGGAPVRRGLGNRPGSPSPNDEMALRLAGALPRFWELRGHMTEGRQWLAQALAAGERAPAEARATALQGAGLLAYLQGDHTVSRTLHEQSLILNQEAGNKSGVAEALRNLGYVALRHGEHAAARTLLEASLDAHTELRYTPGIAGARGALGLLALRQGDYNAARACFEASLALHREMGNKDGIASTLDDLATVAGEQRAGTEQAALLEESLTLYRELGNRQGIAVVLDSLGMGAWARGDHERATVLLEESLTLYREVGDRRGIARLLGHQGFVALYRRDYARAAALCRKSLALYRDVDDPWATARYLPVLAGAVFAQGQPERAAQLFGAATALRDRLGTPLPPVVQHGHDRTVGAVRAVLGNEAFEAAWAEGQRMSLEAAVLAALADAAPA